MEWRKLKYIKRNSGITHSRIPRFNAFETRKCLGGVNLSGDVKAVHILTILCPPPRSLVLLSPNSYRKVSKRSEPSFPSTTSKLFDNETKKILILKLGSFISFTNGCSQRWSYCLMRSTRSRRIHTFRPSLNRSWGTANAALGSEAHHATSEIPLLSA